MSKTILNGFDLCVPSGALVLVQGPSGSGKSTLLRLLCGFEFPQAGRVDLFGFPIADFLAQHPRRHLSYLPQVPTLLPQSVRENLLLGFTFRSNRDLTPPTDGHLGSALAEMGLAALDLDQRADRLSVGQQQRLCLVRNLLLDPRLLLLDEPTASLDVDNTRMVWDCVARFRRDTERTVILVSHQPLPDSLIPDQTVTLADLPGGDHAR